MKTIETKEAGYRQWHSPDPRCVFLLVHGLGTHSGRWEAAADFFLKEGVASYAVELRGIGPAAKPGARQESFDSCYDKILFLCQLRIISGLILMERIILYEAYHYTIPLSNLNLDIMLIDQ